MRKDQDIFELILGVATRDSRIRAVMLNGSRANPQAPKDIFQDFDIVYLVTELSSFRAQPDWIDRFGEPMVMQLPDEFGDGPPPDRYAYLIQFRDGHRLDLTLKTGGFDQDSLSVLLLDKDGTVVVSPPSEADYLPSPPTAKDFFECCNEFWWVAPYVAKGLWREEPIYAQHHLNVIRDQLFRLLEWRIGAETGFQVSLGKLGKHLRHFLTPDRWARLQATYADASLDHIWDALFALTDLFRAVALEVAEVFGFNYRHGDDLNVTSHLRHVRQLPRDAKTVYP
jgi:aminoglycoside 6-adenylyltransferase